MDPLGFDVMHVYGLTETYGHIFEIRIENNVKEILDKLIVTEEAVVSYSFWRCSNGSVEYDGQCTKR